MCVTLIALHFNALCFSTTNGSCRTFDDGGILGLEMKTIYLEHCLLSATDHILSNQ